MRKTLLRTAAATALACVLAAPRPARADWPTFDVITHTLLQQAQNAITTAVTNVEKAVTNIGTTIGNKITNLGTDLSSVLSNGFTQQANYAKAQVGAQQQIADASNTVNATFQKALRSAQIRDEQTLSPQACAALNSGQSVVVAAGQSWRVSQTLSLITDRRGQALPGTPAYIGEGQSAAAITQLHLSRYCNETEAQAGLCTLNAARQNLDQTASSLLGYSAYNPDPAASGVNAANDYATTVIQPIVPAAARADALNSVAGQNAEARRRGYNAKMSLARLVASDVIASRTNSVNLTDDQKAEIAAEGITPTDQSSWLGAMQLEVNRRYSGVAWAAGLQAAPSSKAVEIEIATELAMSNYLAMANYKLNQQIAMVNAALLATAAQAELKPAASMPSPNIASQ